MKIIFLDKINKDFVFVQKHPALIHLFNNNTTQVYLNTHMNYYALNNRKELADTHHKPNVVADLDFHVIVSLARWRSMCAEWESLQMVRTW